MKFLSILLFVVFSLTFTANQKNNRTVKESCLLNLCEFNGIKLYGKVKLVENANEADIKVKIVNTFPDLKVKFVENFANECGEWQIVENNANFKVYITENYPDIKIRPVSSFPGLP